jgi:hypothetical protein
LAFFVPDYNLNGTVWRDGFDNGLWRRFSARVYKGRAHTSDHQHLQLIRSKNTLV